MMARTNRRMNTDRAEVGVGTLIVFIAMVLVAAVAAAVLIGTSGSLQQRAMATGMEATAEVSSNLQLRAVYGIRQPGDPELWDVKIHAQLAAGATPMDLSTLIIRTSNGQVVQTYRYDAAALAEGAAAIDTFALSWIRGGDGSATMVMGDLVEIHFNMNDADGDGIPPRGALEVLLLPETGSPVQADFRAPPTFGSDNVIQLR